MVIVMKSKIISSSPDVMGGTPVFAGTRVPVQTLLDYIVRRESIDSFLDGFPTVTKEQILALLREVKTLIRELVEESETAARYCTR